MMKLSMHIGKGSFGLYLVIIEASKGISYILESTFGGIKESS